MLVICEDELTLLEPPPNKAASLSSDLRKEERAPAGAEQKGKRKGKELINQYNLRTTGGWGIKVEPFEFEPPVELPI
jgi:hypothetical protein